MSDQTIETLRAIMAQLRATHDYGRPQRPPRWSDEQLFVCAEKISDAMDEQNGALRPRLRLIVNPRFKG